MLMASERCCLSYMYLHTNNGKQSNFYNVCPYAKSGLFITMGLFLSGQSYTSNLCQYVSASNVSEAHDNVLAKRSIIIALFFLHIVLKVSRLTRLACTPERTKFIRTSRQCCHGRRKERFHPIHGRASAEDRSSV